MRIRLLATICIVLATGKLLPSGEPALQEIIERLRAYEKRTARLEMILRMDYDNAGFLRGEGPGKGGSAATTSSTSRVVVQDECYYMSRRSQMLTLDGDRKVQSMITAYDGQITRFAYSRLNKIQEYRGPAQPERIPRPDTFFILDWGCPMPFSAFLAASKIKSDTDTSWKVEREEMVNGLRCVRLRNERSFRGGTPSRAYFWLARDRDFLPVKMESFNSRFSETHPVARDQVRELREASPGIWIPWQVRHTRFDDRSVQKGTPIVHQQIDWTVKEVVLDPKHSVEFFRDIQLGDEAEKRDEN